MARQAKEVTIYSNFNSVFTGTIGEFCELHSLEEKDRVALYKKQGWLDEVEVERWKVGKKPECAKAEMKPKHQAELIRAEKNILRFRKKGWDDMVEINYKALMNLVEFYDVKPDYFSTNIVEVGPYGDVEFNVELTPPLYRGDVCKLDKLQLTGKKEEAYLRNKIQVEMMV